MCFWELALLCNEFFLINRDWIIFKNLNVLFKNFSLCHECSAPSRSLSKELIGDVVLLQVIRLMYLGWGGKGWEGAANLYNLFVGIKKSCPFLVEVRACGLASRALAVFQHFLDPLARHPCLEQKLLLQAEPFHQTLCPQGSSITSSAFSPESRELASEQRFLIDSTTSSTQPGRHSWPR